MFAGKYVLHHNAFRPVDFIQLLSAGERSAGSLAACREAEQALHVAIAGLPEDYRDAIRLRHLDGLGLEEVAEQMGRSPDVVRGLLYRARGKLREAMYRSSLWLSRR